MIKDLHHDSPQTIDNTLRKIRVYLSAQFIARGYQGTAGLDARRILSLALSMSQEDLISQGARILTTKQVEQVFALAKRRSAGEPIARLAGTAEFWGLTFTLGPDTLIPRPESEILVTEVLKTIARQPHTQNQNVRLLDVGTGCGCLALSILSEKSEATALAVDISANALKIARYNAQRLNLSDRFATQKSDMLDAIGQPDEADYKGPFDIIFSNPPYILSAQLAHLSAEVRDFDPHLALDGGPDGLTHYRRLIASALSYLKKHGALIVEIGIEQAQPVCRIMEDHGFKTSLAKDLAGHNRVVTGRI